MTTDEAAADAPARGPPGRRRPRRTRRRRGSSFRAGEQSAIAGPGQRRSTRSTRTTRRSSPAPSNARSTGSSSSGSPRRARRYALSTGAAGGRRRSRPTVVAAPTRAERPEHRAGPARRSSSTSAPAVLALDPPAHGRDAHRAVGRPRADDAASSSCSGSRRSRPCELIVGKLIAFGLFCARRSRSLTLVLLVVGFGVPMLGDAGAARRRRRAADRSRRSGSACWSRPSRTPSARPSSCRCSLLLASVFFSGFVLAIDEFSEPVRSLTHAPAGDARDPADQRRDAARLRPNRSGRSGRSAAEVVVYIGIAWLLLRRAMRSA